MPTAPPTPMRFPDFGAIIKCEKKGRNENVSALFPWANSLGQLARRRWPFRVLDRGPCLADAQRHAATRIARAR